MTQEMSSLVPTGHLYLAVDALPDCASWRFNMLFYCYYVVFSITILKCKWPDITHSIKFPGLYFFPSIVEKSWPGHTTAWPDEYCQYFLLVLIKGDLGNHRARKQLPQLYFLFQLKQDMIFSLVFEDMFYFKLWSKITRD